MGLLERAADIVKEPELQRKEVISPVANTITTGEGLYKHSLTYIADEDATGTDKKKILTTEQIAQFPPIFRSFAIFEILATQFGFERCLITGFKIGTIFSPATSSRVLFCKGFDLTTEYRFMMTQDHLQSLVTKGMVPITEKNKLSQLKGYLSSAEYKSITGIFIVKLPELPLWCVIGDSKLNRFPFSVSAIVPFVTKLSTELPTFGIPLSPFLPAPVITNAKEHCRQITDAAIKTGKHCILLTVATNSFFAQYSSLLPETVHYRLLAEFAARIVSAVGIGNIVQVVSESDIRIAVFTAGMIDPDMYAFQLNRSLVSVSATDDSVTVLSSETANDAEYILHFLQQNQSE